MAGIFESKGLFHKVGNSGGGGGDVSSVNGRTGDVVITLAELGGQEELSSGENIKTINGQSVLGSGDMTISGSGLQQYSTMPAASASNVGQIVQYTGADTPEVPESATITQTVGSGLTDLAVDLDTFKAEEHPEDGDVVDFVVDSVLAERYEQSGSTTPNFSASINAAVCKDAFIGAGHDYNTVVIGNSNNLEDGNWWIGSSPDAVIASNVSKSYILYNYGVTISNEDPSSPYDYAIFTYIAPVVSWEKDGSAVNISDYGVSYTGTPVDGDTLEVEYTAFKAGKENGYIYKNIPTYSDPAATISQTTGSGLTDLVVDVDTFVVTEQPAGDETVNFVANVTEDNIEIYDKTPSLDLTVDSANTFIQKFTTDTGLSLADISHTGDCWFTYMNDLYDQSGWSIVYPGGWQSVSDLSLWGFALASEPRSYDGFYVLGVLEAASWYKGDVTVNLSEYGISYSGTEQDGDVITVVYTAPFINSYSWDRIDVQPSSGGGSAGGIEWKTKLDLTSAFQGDLYSASPCYIIRGGLPDGTYEFYFATKTTTGTEYPIGEVIYKVKLEIDNTRSVASANMGYVFNGDYVNDGNTVFGTEDKTLWSVVYKKGSDLLFFNTGRPFSTAILGYVSAPISECFKLSAIKNIETGEEYIAEGEVPEYGTISYDYSYDSNWRLYKLVNEPYVPQYHVNVSSMEYNDANRYIRIAYEAVSTQERMAGCSELDISLKSSNGHWHVIVENSCDSYEARLIEASGDLENVQIGLSEADVYLNLNMPAGSTGVVSCSVGMKGSSETAAVYFQTPSSFTPLDITEVGATITAKMLGKILQYTGTTTASYTNGYFYKATGTEVVVPATIVCYDESPSDCTVTITDVDTFISKLAQSTGWDENIVKINLSQYPNMAVEWDFVNNTANGMYWSAYGGITSSDVLACLSVSTTGSYSGEARIEFLETFTPSSVVVQNPAWVRVNVQPVELPDTTGLTAGNYIPRLTIDAQGNETLSWVAE